MCTSPLLVYLVSGGCIAGRQPERASFGVLADGKAVAGVDHLAAERPDLVERARYVVDLEIGQREGVAWASAPGVDPDRGSAAARLPAHPFALGAGLQLHAEHALPEPARPLGIVRRELHEAERRAVHQRDQMSSTPLLSWSLALPSPWAMRPSTTIAEFQ